MKYVLSPSPSGTLRRNPLPRAFLLSLDIHSSALHRHGNTPHHLALGEAQSHNRIPAPGHTVQHHSLHRDLPHGIDQVRQLPHLGAHPTHRLDPQLDAVLGQRARRGAVDGADRPLGAVAGDLVGGGRGHRRGGAVRVVVALGAVLWGWGCVDVVLVVVIVVVVVVVRGRGVVDVEGRRAAPGGLGVADAYSVLDFVARRAAADGAEDGAAVGQHCVCVCVCVLCVRVYKSVSECCFI